MRTAALLIAISISLSACSMLGAMLPGFGGGTNVAANTQVGKENNQTGVVVGDAIKNDLSGVTQLGKINQADNAIEAANVTINSLPPWVLLLIVLGWVLPSPMEIYTGTIKALTRTLSYIGKAIVSLIKLIRGK